jgi:hypothetical protein
LHALARNQWNRTFRQMFSAASERFEADRARRDEPRMRIRFGTYFYAEPDPPAPAAVPASTDEVLQAPTVADGAEAPARDSATGPAADAVES